MAPEKVIQLKQNTILAFSVGTFLTVASGIFWIGQQFERTKVKINNAVSVYEFDRWERRTQKLNPGWVGAGALEIRADQNAREVASEAIP